MARAVRPGAAPHERERHPFEEGLRVRRANREVARGDGRPIRVALGPAWGRLRARCCVVGVWRRPGGWKNGPAVLQRPERVHHVTERPRVMLEQEQGHA